MKTYKPLRAHPNTPKGTLLDPAFSYTPASHTNIQATFARVRLEQALKRRGEIAIVEPKT